MIKEPELELHPQHLIAANKKREDKINFIKAISLDIFLVFYSILVVQRAIFYKFILDMRTVPFSWNNIIFLFLISAVIGTSWAFTRTSLSCKLFGIAKVNNIKPPYAIKTGQIIKVPR